jgi:hypothetical protein
MDVWQNLTGEQTFVILMLAGVLAVLRWVLREAFREADTERQRVAQDLGITISPSDRGTPWRKGERLREVRETRFALENRLRQDPEICLGDWRLEVLLLRHLQAVESEHVLGLIPQAYRSAIRHLSTHAGHTRQLPEAPFLD